MHHTLRLARRLRLRVPPGHRLAIGLQRQRHSACACASVPASVPSVSGSFVSSVTAGACKAILAAPAPPAAAAPAARRASITSLANITSLASSSPCSSSRRNEVRAEISLLLLLQLLRLLRLLRFLHSNPSRRLGARPRWTVPPAAALRQRVHASACSACCMCLQRLLSVQHQ